MAVQLGMQNFMNVPPPPLSFQAPVVTGMPPPVNMSFPPPTSIDQNSFIQPVAMPQHQQSVRHALGPASGQGGATLGPAFDGRRMRSKAVAVRKTVDYNMTILSSIQNRIWQRDERDMRALQPDSLYQHMMVTPSYILDSPVNCVMTKSVRTALNKVKCPIFSTCVSTTDTATLPLHNRLLALSAACPQWLVAKACCSLERLRVNSRNHSKLYRY